MKLNITQMQSMKILYVLGVLLIFLSFWSGKMVEQENYHETLEKAETHLDASLLLIEETTFNLRSTEKTIEEKLDYYFSQSEIEPDIVVNNKHLNNKDITIGKHKIKWINEKDKVRLKINNDLFTISDYKSLNVLWGEDSDTDKVDYLNQWNQIKLYKFDDRELLGIQMYFEMCTGLGCAVSYSLVYDLKTKNKNFFGTYCMASEVKLYDFNRDEQIDYLGKTYVGDRCVSDGETKNIYRLFTLDNKGNFILQKDKDQKEYFIKHSYWKKDFETTTETVEENWIDRISN